MLAREQAAANAQRVRQELVTITGGAFDPKREVTCEFCPYNDNCEFVWDHYNTDGDCLAIK